MFSFSLRTKSSKSCESDSSSSYDSDSDCDFEQAVAAPAPIQPTRPSLRIISPKPAALASSEKVLVPQSWLAASSHDGTRSKTKLGHQPGLSFGSFA